MTIEMANPTHKLAESLHTRFCSWNHTDGCGWDYEEDLSDDPWRQPDHQHWIKKAEDMRQVVLNTLPPELRVYHHNTDGSVELWDVDEDWWPEGLWMRVCANRCHNGPLNDGEVFCSEHQN